MYETWVGISSSWRYLVSQVAQLEIGDHPCVEDYHRGTAAQLDAGFFRLDPGHIAGDIRFQYERHIRIDGAHAGGCAAQPDLFHIVATAYTELGGRFPCSSRRTEIKGQPQPGRRMLLIDKSSRRLRG